MNVVYLLGRLGNDPEMRTIPTGATVTKFTIATNESYTKDGQKVEKTEWHRIVVWGRQAESCAKYLSKGRQVLVEGKIQTRSWDDKDGKKQYATEIVANQVYFLDKPTAPKNEVVTIGAEDGLPF